MIMYCLTPKSEKLVMIKRGEMGRFTAIMVESEQKIDYSFSLDWLLTILEHKFNEGKMIIV